MTRAVRFATLAIAAVAGPVPALGQGEPLVVTASRQPSSADQLPYWIKVIDAAELGEAESLDGALARLPDVYIQSPGGRTGFASLFLRGADPNFTVVMFEGVPLNSPTNSRGGAVNLAAIPTGAIGRVELVAGPASTLFGSGALAGAVNLLLPEPPTHPRFGVTAMAGTEGELLAGARWQGPLALGWGATLSAVADDAGSAVPRSGFRSHEFDLLLASQRDRRDRVAARFSKSRSHGWPDNSGGPEYAARDDDVDERAGRELVVSASHGLAELGSFRLALSGGYLSRADDVTSPGVDGSPFSPGGVPAGFEATRYRSLGLRPVLEWSRGAWRANVGIAAQWEHGESEGYLDFGVPVPAGFAMSRETRSVYADVARVTGPVTVEGGLRFDSIAHGPSRTTGRAGIRAALTERLAFKASAGSAWKAPSFYALANPFVGNPDLVPETGTSVEAGLEHAFAPGGALAVTVFRSRYRNLIDFVPGDVPRLENRAEVEAQGIASAIGAVLVPGLRLDLSAQYVDTTDPGDPAPLLHRPHWRAAGSLHWYATDRLDLRLRHVFTDVRYDFANPVGQAALDPTHDASLVVDWRPGGSTRLQAVVDNLLGERQGDAIGHAALPRRLRVGFSWTFE